MVYESVPNKSNGKRTLGAFTEKRSANCNICRNFSNIFDRSHRLSTYHQNKLTERFKIIRKKMKMIKLDSIAVHDEQWGKGEDMWCYFCDKSVEKHQVFEGCTIVYLGYLTHLTDFQHIEAVKSYLKYHSRNENIELFCKTKTDLEKFLDKIPEAKKKYLSKLNFLHHKDVAHIKEVEAQRQLLVSNALQMVNGSAEKKHLQVSNSTDGNQAANFVKDVTDPATNMLLRKKPPKQNPNLNQKPKICPWLLPLQKESNDHQVLEKPVIGPTIDTLKNYVADQKKKLLPVKRLGANFQRKKVYSSHWLPSFSGIWNKGRHRQMKSNNKHTK